MGAPVHNLATKVKEGVTEVSANSKRHSRHMFSNRLFRFYFLFSILALCFVLGLVILFIGKTALLLFGHLSPADFFFSFNWTPEEDSFGAAAFIVNTLSLTALTLLIAVPISVGMAVLCAEIAPKWMKTFIRPVLDLLVGIPSIVYGYLGLTVLLPFLRRVSGESLGDGLLAAALVLALMVLPTICRISDDAIVAVPRKYRDAAYALGSTRLQVIMRVVLPAASRDYLCSHPRDDSCCGGDNGCSYGYRKHTTVGENLIYTCFGLD